MVARRNVAAAGGGKDVGALEESRRACRTVARTVSRSHLFSLFIFAVRRLSAVADTADNSSMDAIRRGCRMFTRRRLPSLRVATERTGDSAGSMWAAKEGRPAKRRAASSSRHLGRRRFVARRERNAGRSSNRRRPAARPRTTGRSSNRRESRDDGVSCRRRVQGPTSFRGPAARRSEIPVGFSIHDIWWPYRLSVWDAISPVDAQTFPLLLVFHI